MFVLVKATPGEALVELPGQRRPAGYFQRFGVTASTEREMKELVIAYLQKDMDSTVIEIELQGAPEFDGVDAEVRPLVGDTSAFGIWYASGRSFYMTPKGGKQQGEGERIDGK